MDTSAFEADSSWSWSAAENPSQDSENPPRTSNEQDTPKPKREKHYHPRTCRICLETVLPTFNPILNSLPGVLNPAPSVSYVSSDPAAGKLLRPCKCKGSSRYVHEGCLQAWRHADPGYGRRNYWQCPTCGFKYRLERMTWGKWISSPASQIGLTVSVLLLAMFLLGFVADPIINLYLDPYTTITSPLTGEKLEPILDPDEQITWTEHFAKGLASLGLLSFIKVLLAMSPWQWWNIRSSGILGGNGRAAATGRDRLQSISWFVVLIGVGTFLWAVYKGVRAWSRSVLEKAGERVMDVQGDKDDYDDDNEENSQRSPNDSTSRKDQ